MHMYAAGRLDEATEACSNRETLITFVLLLTDKMLEKRGLNLTMNLMHE